MSNIGQFPKYNNIQFIREGKTIRPEYHYLPTDELIYQDSVRGYQFSRPYKQPVQQGDKQHVSIFINGSAATFAIYTCQGEKVTADINPYFVIEDAGEFQGVELDNYLWNFRFSDYSLPDGDYIIRFQLLYPDETVYWRSEPLSVRNDHPNTIYINAYNETNRGDIIFNYQGNYLGDPFVSPNFGLRVQGDVLEKEFTSNDNIFVEQDYETRDLKPTPWNTKQLYIGGDPQGAGHGVPHYMMDKVNQYLASDYINIESRRYTKTESPEWEQENLGKDTTLYIGGVELRSYDRKDEFTDRQGAKIVLYEEPPFPYYLYRAGFTVNAQFGPYYITNSTERDDMIDYLNNTYADLNNYDGFYSFDSGDIIYQNGVNEFYVSAQPIVLTQFIDVDVTVNSNNDTLQMASNGGYVGAVWDLATPIPVNFANRGTNTATGIINNTYPSAGAYTARIFQEDAFTKGFSYFSQQTPVVLNNITGTMPGGLQHFGLSGADFSPIGGVFDLDFLANSRFNIRSIFIINSPTLTGIDPIFINYPATGITGNSNNWLQLRTISLDRCALTQLNLEAFTEDFYDFTPLATAGYLGFSMIPQVTITNNPAAQYITNLRNNGWTVDNP